MENNRPDDIHFYWENFPDFHTNKRSTQFSWWRQRGPPTSLLNRFLPTLNNVQFSFHLLMMIRNESGVKIFLTLFSKWSLLFPVNFHFFADNPPFSLRFTTMTKFHLPTAKFICMFSCTVVLKIDPIDSRPHQSFESDARRSLAKNSEHQQTLWFSLYNKASVEELQIESWYHSSSNPLLKLLFFNVVVQSRNAWRGNGPNRNPIPKWLSNFHNSFQDLASNCM